MARSLTTDVSNAVTSQRLRGTWALDLVLDSETLRMWGGIGTTTIGGNSYLGVGNLGGISAIEESTDMKATGMRFTLAGVNSSLISIAIGEHYQGRTARAYAVFFDESWVPLADAVLLFAGRIDTMQITDSGQTCVIEGTAESRAIALDRPSEVRYYTDQDQQRYFSGDLGLEYVAALVNAEIFWGKVNPGVPSSGSSGAGGGGAGGGSIGRQPGDPSDNSGYVEDSDPGNPVSDDGGGGGSNNNWREGDWGG